MLDVYRNQFNENEVTHSGTGRTNLTNWTEIEVQSVALELL